MATKMETITKDHLMEVEMVIITPEISMETL